MNIRRVQQTLNMFPLVVLVAVFVDVRFPSV